MAKTTVDTKALLVDPLMVASDVVAGGSAYRRPQGAPAYVLILTRGGIGYVGARRQTAGDLLLIEPGGAVGQDTEPTRSWQRTWALFEPRPSWFELLQWPYVAARTMQLHLPSVRQGAPVRSALDAMVRHTLGAARQRKALAMNALERALLLCDAHNPLAQQADCDPRVRDAMDHICRSLDQTHDVESIAASCGLSGSHLSRLFREHVGQTPMQFVERRRMQRAAELLAMTDRAITSIARQVGFDDPFYFSTRFKKFAGVSPRGYRAK